MSVICWHFSFCRCLTISQLIVPIPALDCIDFFCFVDAAQISIDLVFAHFTHFM